MQMLLAEKIFTQQIIEECNKKLKISKKRISLSNCCKLGLVLPKTKISCTKVNVKMFHFFFKKKNKKIIIEYLYLMIGSRFKYLVKFYVGINLIQKN